MADSLSVPRVRHRPAGLSPPSARDSPLAAGVSSLSPGPPRGRAHHRRVAPDRTRSAACPRIGPGATGSHPARRSSGAEGPPGRRTASGGNIPRTPFRILWSTSGVVITFWRDYHCMRRTKNELAMLLDIQPAIGRRSGAGRWRLNGLSTSRYDGKLADQIGPGDFRHQRRRVRGRSRSSLYSSESRDSRKRKPRWPLHL
jgi:hypothetical protein